MHRVAVWAAAAVLPVALLAGACGGGHDADEEEEKPVSAPPRVSPGPIGIMVKLDAAAVARSGVEVEALVAVNRPVSADAYARVLDLTGLAEERGAITAALGRIEKARAALSASSAELARLQALYADGRNASEKALQGADARKRTDEAELQAAEGAVDAQRAVARQRWGEALAEMLERGSPQLEALLHQKQRLLEVTLASGSALLDPGTAVTIESEGGPIVEGRVVSGAPKADPMIQGPAVLCTAPAVNGLLPGMSLVVRVPAGPSVSGVIVPAAAIVWWKGRAWVYVERGAGAFLRTEVPTDQRVPQGWFVASGLAAGTRIVFRGAQALLSEEERGGVRGSEG